MKFLVLTQANKDLVYLNPKRIDLIRPSTTGRGTLIKISGNEGIHVQESPEEILILLNIYSKSKKVFIERKDITEEGSLANA